MNWATFMEVMSCEIPLQAGGQNYFCLCNLTPIYTVSSCMWSHCHFVCGFVVKVAENGCVCKYTCDMCSGTYTKWSVCDMCSGTYTKWSVCDMCSGTYTKWSVCDMCSGTYTKWSVCDMCSGTYTKWSVCDMCSGAYTKWSVCLLVGGRAGRGREGLWVLLSLWTTWHN